MVRRYVCDLETSRMRRPLPALGRSTTAKKKNIYIYYLKRLVIVTNRAVYGHFSRCYFSKTQIIAYITVDIY